MAELIKVANNHTGYLDIAELVLTRGKQQSSRNGATIEVQDLVIEIADPLFMMPLGVRPGYQTSIGWVEGLQLVAGISDSALTAQIQPNFRAFMETDTGKFWGAYGPRTRDQFPIIAERLRADPDTRQAVVTLWDPKYDTAGGKRDHPCTTAFVFQVRDGRLDMSVLMRSVDLYWGLPYDTAQFGMVQLTLASVLGLKVGKYTHHGVSAHLYEPHWQAVRDMLARRDQLPQTPSYELRIPSFTGATWEAARERAFVTYRVATQTLATSELETFDEWRIAEKLLDRRRHTLVHTQHLINNETIGQ